LGVLKEEGNRRLSKIQDLEHEKCFMLEINEDTLAFMNSLISADGLTLRRINKITHKLWTVKISNEMTHRMEMIMALFFQGCDAIRHLVEILCSVLRDRL
jgi:hypothetical protein